MKKSLFFFLFALTLILVASQKTFAQSQQLVFNHFVETPGSVSTPYSFDSNLRIYSGRLLSVDIYLFDDQTGLPLKSAQNREICNPCSLNFGPGSSRKQTLRIGELLLAFGGFPRNVVTGSIILIVRGGTFSDINPVLDIVNSKTGPFDLDFEFDYGKVIPSF